MAFLDLVAKPSHAALTLLILLLLYTFWWIAYTRFFSPLAKVPGPFFASVSRLWIAFQLKGGDYEVKQRALHKKYGPIVRIAPDEVAISDPAAIKQIYGIKSGYIKTDFYPPFNAFKRSDEVDTNYFTMIDEKLHASRRRITNNIYSMSSVLESEPYIDKCSELFVQRMGQYADEKAVVDLGNWLQMYAFDVVGELYFGAMFGFMLHNHDHGGYIESLDTFLPPLIAACVLPLYMRFFLPVAVTLLPAARKAVKCLGLIVKAAEDSVKAREDDIRTGKSVRKDILAKLFEIRDKRGDELGFHTRDIMQEAYIAIFAGSDTTAIALRAIFDFVLRNQAVYKRLVADIDNATKDETLSTPSVRYAEAIKLPYLVAVVKEAMRLHPSVAMGMPRHVPEGGAQLVGVFIPEGYRVGINPAVIHYDTTIFGDDAANFNPDRWLGDDTANLDKHMLHFGGGSRTCVGKNISLSEIHKLVPQVLREFDIELVDKHKPVKLENFWFNKQLGLRVRMRRRTTQS